MIWAPAGSGKSVLAAAWARGYAGPAVAWLNCGSPDDSPASFWSSSIELLGSAIGRFPSLRPVHLASVSADRADLLDPLLEWLDQLPSGTALILDDFQALASQATLNDLNYILRHLPDPLALTIVSRSWPPLDFSAVRAAGRLREVDAADLAFTEEETLELIRQNSISLPSADLRLPAGHLCG